jgi:hypothetical protein
MPTLLYYVSAPGAPIGQVEGVCASALKRFEIPGLSACYSEIDLLPQDSAKLAEEAVRFFQVQQEGFAAGSIVPFRFPSMFADEAALRDFLLSQSAELTRALVRISAMSQFDIRISTDQPGVTPQSGTEYLRSRASQSAAIAKAESRCRTLLADIAREWIVRHDSVRTTLHVLVPRSEEQETADRFRALAPPSDCRLVILGPWPPGAFVGTDTARANHD